MEERHDAQLHHCAYCGVAYPPSELIPHRCLHNPSDGLLLPPLPTPDPTAAVCARCLLTFRRTYLHDLQFNRQEALQPEEDLNSLLDRRRTFGERVADHLASFVGSWTFLASEVIFLGLWILINTALVVWGQFDPYPFIFLNLVLSWVAALQAPLILMSQNRQDARDRQHSQHDYAVNLKAEMEIRQLHLQLEQVLTEQWHQWMQVRHLLQTPRDEVE